MVLPSGPLCFTHFLAGSFRCAIHRSHAEDRRADSCERGDNDPEDSDTYDPEKASSLLKSAGREGMKASFQTAAIAESYVSSATLISQQAKAAGMNLEVDVIPSSTYYTEAGGYPERRFMGQASAGGTAPSLTVAYLGGPWAGAPFNLTHWGLQRGEGRGRAALPSARSARHRQGNRALARGAAASVRRGRLFELGVGDFLDAVGPDVRGLKTSPLYYLNGYRLLDGWLAEA